ncbi:MAG: hypothetical protein IKY02_01630, partial [Lachnospiraceae bacterium]|nr:hypothetical protein [Lachnospiraceae bacterium]
MKSFKLIPQVFFLFALSVLVTGIVTFITQSSLSDSAIRQQTETLASEISEEVTSAVREYPASDWLLSYWYSHAEEMEIEYDVEYVPGTKTEEKCRVLSSRYPGIQIRYATEPELENMAPEDRKLYAEVAYSWLITRMNEIKRA